MTETVLLYGLYYKLFTISQASKKVSVKFPGTGDSNKSYNLQNCRVSQLGNSVGLTFHGKPSVNIGTFSKSSDYAVINLNTTDLVMLTMTISGWFPIEFLENISSTIEYSPIILGPDPGVTYGGSEQPPLPDYPNSPITLYTPVAYTYVSIADVVAESFSTTHIPSSLLFFYSTIFITTDFPVSGSRLILEPIYYAGSEVSKSGIGNNMGLSYVVFVLSGQFSFEVSFKNIYNGPGTPFHGKPGLNFDIRSIDTSGNMLGGMMIIKENDSNRFIEPHYYIEVAGYTVTYLAGAEVSVIADDITIKCTVTDTTMTFYYKTTGGFIPLLEITGDMTTVIFNEVMVFNASHFDGVYNSDVSYAEIEYIRLDPIEAAQLVVGYNAETNNSFGQINLPLLSINAEGVRWFGANQGHMVLPSWNIGGYQTDNERGTVSIPSFQVSATGVYCYTDITIPIMTCNSGDNINWAEINFLTLSAYATAVYAFGYMFIYLDGEAESFTQGIPGSISNELKPSILLSGHPDLIEISNDLFWGM